MSNLEFARHGTVRATMSATVFVSPKRFTLSNEHRTTIEVVRPSSASVRTSSPIGTQWSVEEMAALAGSFLEQCAALERVASAAEKLVILKQTMAHHFEADWSDTEILALEGLMLFYQRQLLNPELSVADRVEILKRIYTDLEPEWMESEIVQLHFLLLDECRGLADPKCPLAEKLDILRWMLSETTQRHAPFSFHRCARIAWGFCDVASVQDDLTELLPGWLRESVEAYPEQVRNWVWQGLAHDPAWLAERLEKNPQLINERVQNLKRQPDLFSV